MKNANVFATTVTVGILSFAATRAMGAEVVMPDLFRKGEAILFIGDSVTRGGPLAEPTGSNSLGGAYRLQREDPVTRDFIASLRSEPLLRTVLSGHLHYDVAERFSPTAVQFVIGGNFMGHGQELLFT